MGKTFEAHEICKAYGKKQVLGGADLCVPYGEIVGIFGKNGAGKTTLFDCLTGLVSNDRREEYLPDKTKFFYLSKAETFAGFERLKDILEMHAALFDDFDAKKAKTMLGGQGFPLNKRYSQFSLGQKNLIAFIFAICREAEIYFLDEPLSNNDIRQSMLIKDNELTFFRSGVYRVEYRIVSNTGEILISYILYTTFTVYNAE